MPGPQPLHYHFLKDRVLLNSTGWPQTYNLPASAFRGGSQVYITKLCPLDPWGLTQTTRIWFAGQMDQVQQRVTSLSNSSIG